MSRVLAGVSGLVYRRMLFGLIYSTVISFFLAKRQSERNVTFKELRHEHDLPDILSFFQIPVRLA